MSSSNSSRVPTAPEQGEQKPNLNDYSSGRRGGDSQNQPQSYAPRYPRGDSGSRHDSGYGKYNQDARSGPRRDTYHDKYGGYKDRGRERPRYEHGNRARHDDSTRSRRDISPRRDYSGYEPTQDQNYGRRGNSYKSDDYRNYNDYNNYSNYNNNDSYRGGNYRDSNYRNNHTNNNYRGHHNYNDSYNNRNSGHNKFGSSDNSTQMNVPSGPSQYREKHRSNVSSETPRSSQRQSAEPKETIPLEQQISKIEKDLEKYQDVPLIEEIKVLDSRWGTKPKGFENVTAQRAKLSGLFPLPGYPRPVDFTKLEGLLKEESSDLLTETSRINPIDSCSARTLIIKNVSFERISYLKIVEFFNDYLKHIDIPETTQHNISSKRKSKDDKTLIIEFANNTCATIIFTMNKLKLPFNLYKEDAEARVGDDEQIELTIERPHEYVVQALPPYDKINEDDIEESVVDNPRKMTIHVSSELTETNITDALKKIAPLKGFQLPRELGTKKPVGIAFLEFYVDPQITDTSMVISKLEEYLEKVKAIPFVSNAYFSCIIPGVTSIQNCVADYTTLRLLARNEQVTVHPKSRIIQLLNCVTAKDLMEDASYQFIYKDIMQEVSKIGKVKSIKIPRPANDYTPGLQQFSEPGLGKIFVEFDDDEVAFKAIMSLAGRQYNDRTVLCAFYDDEDYKNGLF